MNTPLEMMMAAPRKVIESGISCQISQPPPSGLTRNRLHALFPWIAGQEAWRLSKSQTCWKPIIRLKSMKSSSGTVTPTLAPSVFSVP